MTLEFDLTLFPNPVLRRAAKAVESFDAELEAIVAGMIERMHASKGVGLAAPQVGIGKRILLMSESGNPEDDLVLVNPVILEKLGPNVMFEEGCLSFPGIYAEIERPESCRVRAQDVKGQEFEQTLGGFPARILQHEHDHLEGILLVDRMSPADKVRHRAALEELIEDYKRTAAKPARTR